MKKLSSAFVIEVQGFPRVLKNIFRLAHPPNVTSLKASVRQFTICVVGQSCDVNIDLSLRSKPSFFLRNREFCNFI